MSAPIRPSTADGKLRDVFGAPVADLYRTAAGPDASPALIRALELRAVLALAEGQVTRVRDRVHEAMAPERDMGQLSADQLRFDSQWLEAALEARNGYLGALSELLITMPAPTQQPRPVRMTQHKATVTLPPPAAGAGPPRARRT
ncbi:MULTISPECIES: hypothetical protein [unclassified Streptomyces]|uniref:hypothetical protein n=1 Tax=unclassified Streptomyces TaxID=2593676 RepID=UPI0036305308